jgi:hypothetical protein
MNVIPRIPPCLSRRLRHDGWWLAALQSGSGPLPRHHPTVQRRSAVILPFAPQTRALHCKGEARL